MAGGVSTSYFVCFASDRIITSGLDNRVWTMALTSVDQSLNERCFLADCKATQCLQLGKRLLNRNFSYEALEPLSCRNPMGGGNDSRRCCRLALGIRWRAARRFGVEFLQSLPAKRSVRESGYALAVGFYRALAFADTAGCFGRLVRREWRSRIHWHSGPECGRQI